MSPPLGHGDMRTPADKSSPAIATLHLGDLPAGVQDVNHQTTQYPDIYIPTRPAPLSPNT